MEAGGDDVSDSTLARRTEIAVKLDGIDISTDINRHFLQMTYTDNEADKTDDLRLSLDDREGIWLTNWLNIGGEAVGAELSAVITQKNFGSDGADRILDCGKFFIDGVDGGGPPGTASIKSTSLPYKSTIRTATQTRAWENINLSAIAREIADRSGMVLMFESLFDPLYDRREQVELSDIVFLRGLCYDAGISLKASGGIIVLFDAAEYEQKPTVTKIRRGEANVKSYRFGTSTHDTYARSHVSYTDPQTGQTIEYTFTPRNSDPDGQTLKINERVRTRGEARNLAMRRLRQRNKDKFQAEFTLVGDVRLVAGVTVDIIGWGLFDGKYIIQRATHTVTASGYTLMLKLRRVLEGY